LKIKKGRKSRNHPYAETGPGQVIFQGPYGEVIHTRRCYIGKIPNTEIDRDTGRLVTVRDA